MYTGTLISDLVAAVERAENASRCSLAEPGNAYVRSPGRIRPGAPFAGQTNASAPALTTEWNAEHSSAEHSRMEPSETEQLPQALGLRPADRNLALLLIVHTQLVGALEPGNDFADAVDVYQVGAVRPPEKIRV